MKALLDTNVLLRHANRSDPRQAAVTHALDELLSRRIELCACAQNNIEFWAVSTRPVGANGLGKEPRALRGELDQVLSGFTIEPDPPSLLDTWLELCSALEVRGRQVYDARLAALMIAARIPTLVTLNADDFARYPGLEVIVPVT